MKMQETYEMLKIIKANPSVKSIYRKTIANLVRSKRAGLISVEEMLNECDKVKYRCVLMCNN